MAKINWKNLIQPEAAAILLADRLINILPTKNRVLWLIPGGSALKVAVATARLIPAELQARLVVTLTDERYGAVGHADSNWQQLQEAGFRLPGAKLLPVLSGADILATTRVYNNTLATEIKAADYKMALLGIGPDGHTAGILPHSSAADLTTETGDWATSYDAGNFQRLTMTPRAIAQLDEVFVFAVGEEKWPALEKLNSEQKIIDQPAQALKQAKELTILTDYKTAIV